MANFFALVLCVSMAAIVAAEAASTSVVVMDQCTCTCPSKSADTLMETKSRTRRDAGEMGEKRKKRWFFGGTSTSKSTYYENKSHKDIRGDDTLNSNNGGNMEMTLGEGSVSGDDNKMMWKSHGTVGTDVGQLNSRGPVVIG